MDKTVKLWDAAKAKELRTFTTEQDNHFVRVALSPDDKMLAAGSFASNAVYLWDVSTGELRRLWHTDEANHVNCVAFSPDGNTLASGASDKTVKLWNVSTGELRAHLKVIEDLVYV
jgi:WD40 repeat protein